MKEKIKNWLKENWFKLAIVGVIIWFLSILTWKEIQFQHNIRYDGFLEYRERTGRLPGLPSLFE